jgi:ribosome biogenesis GTPase
MTPDFSGLAEYGWSTHFQLQIAPDDAAMLMPMRVLAVHRSGLDVAGVGFVGHIPPLRADTDEGQVAVGDWLLVDRGTYLPRRLLQRRSLFRRKAAGNVQRIQVIAANVDTLFVVTSCNHDFNLARLERYLALAREADVTPVVVITKADLVDDPQCFAAEARKLMSGLLVEAIDARDAEAAAALQPWCRQGQTVAFAGSSGVGKSTLIGTLTGAGLATAPIREDDAHGRHTTTARSMHRLAAGGWLIDTPGMRELQLADSAGGIDDVFADIVAIAQGCRFADCAHESEPGCAVRTAIEVGTLDGDRLARYRKLAREDARNSEAIWQRRARERSFGRMVREHAKDKRDKQ